MSTSGNANSDLQGNSSSSGRTPVHRYVYVPYNTNQPANEAGSVLFLRAPDSRLVAVNTNNHGRNPLPGIGVSSPALPSIGIPVTNTLNPSQSYTLGTYASTPAAGFSVQASTSARATAISSLLTCLANSTNINPNGISVRNLVKLIEAQAQQGINERPSLILLDCRDSASFTKSQIQHSPCVNIVPIENIKYEGFPSKAAVISLLQEKFPSLFVRMKEPSYYSNIVIFDENSTVEKCSEIVKIIRGAMLKWIEQSPVKVRILQGGMNAFLKEPIAKMVHTKGSECTEMFSSEVQSDLKRMTLETSSIEAKTILEGFARMLNVLDSGIYTAWKLISLRESVKSLEAVKLVLMKENETLLAKELESRIPEEVKCPVCFEVYSGEIIQCGNGHGVCCSCFEKIKVCPECRIKYAVDGVILARVPNRAIEKLMLTALEVECPCGESVLCKEAYTHARQCANENKKKKVEICKVEEEVESTEIQISNLTSTLEKIDKEIIDTEKTWRSKRGCRKENIIPDECKNILGIIDSKKAVLNRLNVTLISSVFFLEKCVFKKP